MMSVGKNKKIPWGINKCDCLMKKKDKNKLFDLAKISKKADN